MQNQHWSPALTSVSETLITNSKCANSERLRCDSELEASKQLAIKFDRLKISYGQEYKQEIEEGESDLDIDDEIELEMLDDIEFGQKLAEMVEREDGKDADWYIGAQKGYTTFWKLAKILAHKKCRVKNFGPLFLGSFPSPNPLLVCPEKLSFS